MPRSTPATIFDAENATQSAPLPAGSVSVRRDMLPLTLEYGSPSGIIMADTDGRIVMVNAQAERLFLYDRAELLGQPLEILVPERFREGHLRLRTAFLAGPTVCAFGAGRGLRGRRRDGTEFPMEIG